MEPPSQIMFPDNYQPILYIIKYHICLCIVIFLFTNKRTIHLSISTPLYWQTLYSFMHKVTVFVVCRGRKRFVSEGDGGKVKT